MGPEETAAQPVGRGWPRAAAMLGVTLATSVMQPGILVAVPFLALVAVRGAKGRGLFVATFLSALYVVTGARDGLWYVGRAWALLLAGWFAGLTLAAPATRLTGRALGSLAGAAAAVGGLLLFRGDAWAMMDFAVADAVRGGVARTVDAITLLRGGEALSPALVSAIYETAEAQVSVFPALTGIASISGLAVAWWLYERLRGAGDQAIGPVRDFKFNDHLVWIFILGLLLVLGGWDGALTRVGSNTVVFMGALYALRGAAVFMFVSGGMSLFGYVMLTVGLLLAAPVVVGIAMMVGIGDTWLDARARLQRRTS